MFLSYVPSQSFMHRHNDRLDVHRKILPFGMVMFSRGRIASPPMTAFTASLVSPSTFRFRGFAQPHAPWRPKSYSLWMGFCQIRQLLSESINTKDQVIEMNECLEASLALLISHHYPHILERGNRSLERAWVSMYLSNCFNRSTAELDSRAIFLSHLRCFRSIIHRDAKSIDLVGSSVGSDVES